jgi:hypothetical protein
MEAGGMEMEEEVKEAYKVVKRIDVLDVSVGTYTHSFRFCLFVYLFADSWGCRGDGDMGGC